MASLANLGQIGSAFGGGLPDAQMKWLKVQEAQQQLDQMKKQIQAEAAAGSAFGAQPGPPPMPQQGPMPPPPGQSSQPANPPMQQQGGVAAPAPPQQPPPGQAGPPPGGGGGGPSPGGAAGPQGMLTIDQLADRIRKRNPNIDNVTLFMALKQAEPVMAPQDKMQMQSMMLDARLAMAANAQATKQAIADANIHSREGIADLKLSMAKIIADQHNATNITIADKRIDAQGERQDKSIAATNQRTNTVQDRIDARAAARRGASATDKAAVAQYKALYQERTAVKDEIAAAGGVATSEQTQRLTQANDRIVKFWTSKGKQSGLPSPADLEKPGAGGPAAPGQPPDPGAAASPGGIPPGAPTATGPDNKKIYWDGTQWKPAPAQ